MIRATMRVAGLGGAVLVAGLLCGPLTAGKDKAPEIPPRKGESKTIKLFNGEDLKGWEGYKDLWSVKDGVIRTLVNFQGNRGSFTMPVWGDKNHLALVSYQMLPAKDNGATQ